MGPNLMTMLSVARLRRKTYRTVPCGAWGTRVVYDRKERICSQCGERFTIGENRRCGVCHDKEGRLGKLAMASYGAKV
jgi:hypothetical protein